MGLISKITGHSSSSSDSTTAHDNKVASGHSQPGLDNRTGTTTSSAATTAPHAHTGSTTGHSTGTSVGSTTGTHGTTGTNYGESRTTGQKVEDAVLPGQPSQRNTATGTHGTTGSSSSTGYDKRSTTGTHSTTGVGSTTGTHGTSTNYGDNRTTGEKVKDAILPGSHGEKTRRKKHREPGYVRSGRSSSSSSSSSDDEKRRHGTTRTSSRDVNHQGGRLGDLHLNEHDLGSAKGEHTVKHAAPVIAEHVHDRYEHVDKTRVEELREKTEVTQTVQPVYDEVKHGATHERVDHGLEVHEHGNRGLDKSAEAELARKREQIAREHRSTHDEETRQTSLRPDVDVHHRTNVVEEVVPVIEKDIYRPHEIEHVKHEVHVHHEAPVVKGTKVAKPISVSEYERASGVKIHELRASDHGTRETLTTDRHTHGTHGGVTGRDGSYDNTSSTGYDSTTRSTTGTHSTSSTTHSDDRSIGQKIKDTIMPGSSTTNTGTSSRDYDNSRNTGSGYDNTRSTGSGHDETQRGHGTGIGSNTHGTGLGSTGTHGTGTNYGDSRTTGQKVEDAVLPGQHHTSGTHTGAAGNHQGLGHTGTQGQTGQHALQGQAERGVGSKIDQQTGHPGVGQQAVNAGERATGHGNTNTQSGFTGGHVLPSNTNTGNTNTRL